eukprot:TRINITY_DN3973_c0_g1_i9.p1 TRINITY_DN3973_c0_g1~~TRINITY_DN3973_c0_g1_i9.p1  ORF type:complete len:255 (-),score=65.11 TRINITY_DN3973_c0_g1_i9:511-1212(-)
MSPEVLTPDFHLDYEVAEEAESGAEDSDPEIIKANHRKSLILLEQSLMVPCDQSPIAPETLKKQELFSDGNQLQKLMYERLLLRKELRLRTMQERLLDQEGKLEAQEQRIKELESQIIQLTSAPDFINTCIVLSGYCRDGIKYSFELIRRKGGAALSYIGQAFLYLFDMIPPWISLGMAALVHWFGTLIAQRAENFTNERAERAAQASVKSSSSDTNQSVAAGHGRNMRRRRR